MKILKCDKVIVDSNSMTAYLKEDPVAMLSENRLIIFKKPEHASWDWAIRQVLEQGERTMSEKCFCDNCGEQVGLSEAQWVYYKPGEMVKWLPLSDPIRSDARKLADEINALREEYHLTFNEALLLARPFLYQ